MQVTIISAAGSNLPPQRNNQLRRTKNWTNEKTHSFQRFLSLPDQPGFKGSVQVRSWRSADELKQLVSSSWSAQGETFSNLECIGY